MDDKKLLLIYNPHAGKARIKNNLLSIIDIFTKAGYEVTARPTQKQGDAIQLTKECASRFERIVCSGGDGTLDEVVTGMMQSDVKVPIGYIPAGSTNDFARSLNIPKEMTKAAEVAVYGDEFLCDVGTFNNDTFVYIAAFGLFTDVSYETNQQMKNTLGHMAYVLEGMKRLSAIKSYCMKVIADGNEYAGDFLYGMITNSKSVGGFNNITGKNVEFNDGQFEITLIKRPKNPIEFTKIMEALVAGKIDNEHIYSFKASDIVIETEETVAWTLDGEFGGNHGKVMIKNRQAAVTFMVPNS